MAEADPAEKATEEIYAAVGRALSAWSHVEESLCAIFVRTTVGDPRGAVQYVQTAFWAVESFRGKLNVIDAALKLRFVNSPECLAMWSVIYRRARSKNNLRNELAHGTVMNFGPATETYFVPSFYKNLTTEVTHMMASIAAEQEKGGIGGIVLDIRPKGRLTVQQISHRTQAFNMFKIRLDRFNHRLFEEIRKT